jgi:type IV pilus assembly protein PilB
LREEDVPRDIVRRIPREQAEALRAVAFAENAGELWIGMVDPTDFQAVQTMDFLAQSQKKTARFATISDASLAAVLKRYEQLESEVARALEAAKNKFEEQEQAVTPAIRGGESLEQVVRGAPVSSMVATMMRYAVEQGASDIHIEPLGKKTRVRYRIDGVLKTVLSLPDIIHPAIISRIKVLASLKLDESRTPQDGRITENINGKVVDFRVSTLPVVDNEKVVMRILDTAVGVPTLAQLGFRPEHVKMIESQIRLPHGLFLVSGPTGSGKSTSLYTSLSILNSEGLNIVTLEDPVEYYIHGVNQSQIRPEIGYTFASGLRSLLRQDPNVIMVGEIRDKETAELAVHAGLTGHLIFSTIHTNDVFGVIPRLVDLGVEPFLLSATLNAAVAQRLARKICEDCKAPEEIPEMELTRFREELRGVPKHFLTEKTQPDGALTFWRGVGCDACHATGYAGRVAVAEILLMTRQLQRIVVSGFKPQEVQAEAARQEMITLRQDAILKALDGLTTVQEVLRITEENPMV